MDKKQIKRMFGYRPNLNEILTGQVAIEKLWNKLLSNYALDKKIVNYKKLFELSANELTITEQNTLKQMNDEPYFDDKKKRCWQLKVIRKLKANGICPYFCEVPITLKVNVYLTIMNLRRKKNVECTLYKQHILTVIKYADTDKHQKRLWECRCDCGATTYATTSALKNGYKKSCGCLKHTSNANDLKGLG